MLLIYTLIIILAEAITEGLLKRYNKLDWIFDPLLQWVIAIFLFFVWFIAIALQFDGYYVPVWKLICGFIGVRWLVFDFSYNLAAGNKWYYYGTRKWYDITMTKLGEYGLMLKVIAGIMGICFLMGWS